MIPKLYTKGDLMAELCHFRLLDSKASNTNDMLTWNAYFVFTALVSFTIYVLFKRSKTLNKCRKAN